MTANGYLQLGLYLVAAAGIFVYLLAVLFYPEDFS